jgi:hypothetical protein
MRPARSEWWPDRMCASGATGNDGDTTFPTPQSLTMRSNPFLSFHRAAEAAGYPALQVATMVVWAGWSRRSDSSP